MGLPKDTRCFKGYARAQNACQQCSLQSMHGLTRAPRAIMSLQFNLTQHCDKLKADEHACYTGLHGLHRLTKHLLIRHVTRASRAHHDHANQQRSSTGLQANVQSVTRAPRARNGLAIQFIKHCDKLNAMQCYTGLTGSTGLPKTCMLHGLHGLSKNWHDTRAPRAQNAF